MMEILPMTWSYVPQIAQLEALAFPDPWSEKSIAGELENPISLWLVCVEGDTVCGYIGSQTAMDEADMMNIAVHPQFRRQGIGRNLITVLESKLRERGAVSLTLEVRCSNAPAIALYRELGFRQVGKRPNYYRHPREDGLILRKELET